MGNKNTGLLFQHAVRTDDIVEDVFANVSVDTGLHYQDSGDEARVWGVVDGYPIQVDTEARLKYTKHRHIAVKGTLKFADAPSGFCLAPEGVGSGFQRIADRRELESGNDDFDNAFWVTADDPEALREYLTEERCYALLHWLHRYGDGEIRNGVLERSTIQAESGDAVGPILSQFMGLAKAFAGDHRYHQSTKNLPSGWVAARKLRLLAFFTGALALAFWVLPMEVHLPAWVVQLDHLLMGLSAITCVFAVLGKRLPIFILGALLAVATTASALVVALALVMQGHNLGAVMLVCGAAALGIPWAGSLMTFWHLKG